MGKGTFNLVLGILLLVSNVSISGSSPGRKDVKRIPLNERRTTGRVSKPASQPVQPFKIALRETGSQSKTAYGVLLYDDELLYELNSLVSFDVADAATFEVVQSLGGKIACAGAYAKDKYYVVFTKIVNEIEIPGDFYEIDLETEKVRLLGTLSGFERMINDMSYDYSTNKMYAAARLANGNSALYTIDLADGSSRKEAELDRHFFTLACSYAGQLYGVSRTGMLCKIDKESGRVEEVADTEIQPSYLQSMEFDHTDKTLYWAVSAIDETTCMATLDVETAVVTPTGPLGANAEIAGLYIPFTASADNTPAAVANLAVQADQGGASSATLKWKNPAETFGGTPLETLTKVEVYRNERLIYTKDNPVPGAEEAYVDEIEDHAGLMVTYKIVAANENGPGVHRETTLFVGRDLPGAPDGLQLVKNGCDRIALSWKAPKKGQNGGWTDLSSLSFQVVRLPDNKIVAEHVKETACTDVDIAPANTYRYQVVSVNSAGTGGEARTDGYVLGPENTIPYFCDFATEEIAGTWTIVNRNNDNRTWNRDYNSMLRKYVMSYQYSGQQAADDWLIAHNCVFEKGMTYRLSFLVSSLLPNNLRFVLGKGVDPDLLNQEIARYEEVECDEYIRQSFTFTVEETDSYNLGIQLYSPENRSWVGLTDIQIEPIVPDNLAAITISGNQHPVVRQTYAYSVEVCNKGTALQETYTVSLKDGQTGTEFARREIAEVIQPGETKRFTLDWQPLTVGSQSITGMVSCAGDHIVKDNVTEPLAINVQPEGSSEIIPVGISEDYSYRHPFNFYETKSAAMNIYAKNEIGQEGGVIEKISYLYNNASGSEVTDTPVKIYMGNTELANTAGGWIDEDKLTLVYDGPVSFTKGKNELEIVLDQNFAYSGENLAVLTIQSMPGGYYNYIQFPYYTSELEGNKALLWTGYKDPFDFTMEGKQGTSNSSVTFTMLCQGATISGKVEGDENVPLAHAAVTLVERKTTVTTDAGGQYVLGYVPDGTYTLTCSLHGYPDVLSSNIVVAEGKDVERNLRMTNLPSYKVEGVVLTPEGQPVSSAVVKLTGYDNLETTTSESGKFLFDQVLIAEHYKLILMKDWYKTHEQAVDVADADIDLGEIRLDYYIYRPVNAAAEENADKQVRVTWQTPDHAMSFRKDDGKVSGQYGVTNGAGKTVLGTIYRTPAVLNEVSWYTTREGGPHHAVDLFIFDLDESGEPTNKILYSERSVRNTDDQWMIYPLPESIQAPNGFMIALNYPGYLGIGVDSGTSVEYPFENRVHSFAADYTNGEFDYLDATGGTSLTQNLMYRASGRVLPDNYEQVAGERVYPESPDEKPAFWAYKIWRFVDKELNTPEKWALLTEVPIAQTEYTDRAWKELDPGVYRYAVRIAYPDGRVSQPVFTPYKAYNMETDVTVNVKTNDKPGSAEDAVVTLTDSKGKQSAGTVTAENKVLFTKLWKDHYDIEVSKEGFEPVHTKGDFSFDNAYSTPVFVLKEKIVTPYHLDVVEKENNQALFTWNTTGTIVDDFEAHEDFAINSAGNVGWQYLDLDENYTYSFNSWRFPKESDKKAFIVFNPSATTPAMSDVDEIRPHSGSKFLACFAAENGNNDYLISPPLKFFEDFTFSFFAKSYSNYDGYIDLFNVGYSVTGKEPDDFIWIDQLMAPSADNWNEYSYTIPAGAGYVAVNCVTTDGFVLMIDDIRIEKKQKNRMVKAQEVETNLVYEVYLDGKKVSETTDCNYLFSGLAQGKHVAGVKAVYYSGASGLVTYEFGNGTAIGSSATPVLSVYPNPARDYLKVEGDYTRLELNDISGRCIARYGKVQDRIDVSELPEGIYLLVVTNEDGSDRSVVKVSIRK